MQNTSNEKKPKLSILTNDEIDELNKKVKFLNTSSGIKLAYREYGNPGGDPIVFFHGTGAHIHPMMLHKPGKEYNFRIIVPTRPGIADSEFREWTHLDYADDIKELVKKLKLKHFGIMGISGGGPTLMAYALKYPDDLACVINLACAAPVYNDPEMQKDIGFVDRVYAKLADKAPLSFFRLSYGIVELSQKFLKSPKSFVKMFSSSLCEADKKLFEIPDFQNMFMRDFQESFKHGTKGPSYDAQRIVQDWGFDVSDIEPHVDIFQGKDDLFVPMKISKYYEKKLKDFEYHIIQGEGHFYTVAHGYETLSKIRNKYFKNQ